VFYSLIPAIDSNGDGEATTDEAASLLSNFLISVEMLAMAGGCSKLSLVSLISSYFLIQLGMCFFFAWTVFAFAFPPSDYAVDGAAKSTGGRYVLQRPGHETDISTAASLTNSLIDSNDDFEVGCHPFTFCILQAWWGLERLFSLLSAVECVTPVSHPLGESP
jgi:hypothetical protein